MIKIKKQKNKQNKYFITNYFFCDKFQSKKIVTLII